MCIDTKLPPRYWFLMVLLAEWCSDVVKAVIVVQQFSQIVTGNSIGIDFLFKCIISCITESGALTYTVSVNEKTVFGFSQITLATLPPQSIYWTFYVSDIIMKYFKPFTNKIGRHLLIKKNPGQFASAPLLSCFTDSAIFTACRRLWFCSPLSCLLYFGVLIFYFPVKIFQLHSCSKIK